MKLNLLKSSMTHRFYSNDVIIQASHCVIDIDIERLVKATTIKKHKGWKLYP